MVDKIQGAEVVIGGDVSEAERAIDSLSDSVKGLGKLAKIALAAFATAQLASFFHTLVAGAQESIDVMSKMARQNDATVTGVQALRRAADLSGVSLETLTNSAKQLNVSIGELTTKGTGPAVQALKTLGITASDLAGLDIDQKFGLIADKMKKLNLTASEQQAILRDLRIEHATVQNLLEGGSATFDNARKDVERFGQAISDIDAVQVEIANDAMTSLGEVLKGIGTQIAVVLAPVIKGLMTDFDDWAASGNKVRQTIESAMAAIVKSIGAVADVVAVVRLGFQKLFQFVASEVQIVVDGMKAMRDGIVGVLNVLPLLGPTAAMQAEAIKTAGSLAADGLKKAVDGSVSAIREGLGGEFPSESLDKWLARVRETTAAAAKEITDQAAAHREAAGRTSNVMSEEAKKQLEAQQKAAATNLDALIQRLADQEELEMMSYQRRLQQLVAYHEQGLLTNEQYNALILRNEEMHLEKMNAAQAASFTKSQQLYTGFAGQIDTLLGNITQAIGSEGKKQFAITKAISIAQALVKGYESIVSSYAAGAKIGGPPVGAAYAAISAAATAVQIAALRSTNENSGGGGGAGAASGGDAGGAAPTQTLILQGTDPGQIFTGDSLRGFLDRVAEYVNDGGKRIEIR
jgi:hypothetical protein